MSEQCVRCGEEGEDRRTLWHSCLYAMDELNVPFKEVRVIGDTYDKIGDKEFWIGDEAECRRQGFKPHLLPEFPEDPTGQVDTEMFKLRVCKQCRSDWMKAIEDWFNNVEPRRRVGTGIFVRKNGATVEVTYQEWEKMRGD